MKQLNPKHEKSQKGIRYYLLMGILCFLGFFFIMPLLMSRRTFSGLFMLAVIAVPLYFIAKRYLKKPNIPALPGRVDETSFVINGTTTIENPFAGIFISGGAGSGKSKSLIEPLIREAGEKNYTGVIYDFKFPELAKYAATAYEQSTVTAHFFNFNDLNHSIRINPIAPNLMRNESFAREFAYTILANLNPSMVSKPDFWSDNSVSMLSATFWYLREKWPNYCTLPHAVSMILQPNLEALLYELASVPKCADMIAPILTAYQQKADNQLAGIMSSLQVSLSKINLDEMYYLLTGNDVSLEVNNPEEKKMIVIGNDPVLSSTYAPIIGLILTSISKQLNRPEKEKSIFMIDEFPTVFIPGVEQLPATARSNRVATILAAQDISQIVDKYGKDKSETILSNLGNQFYGRTPNIDTARRVIALFGKYDKRKVSTSKKNTDYLKHSRTVSTQESDYIKPQDVANLDTGTFYTVLSEGSSRQGISRIPLRTFEKSPLPIVNHVDERQLRQAFDAVKLDLEVILRKAKEAL